MVKKMVKSSQKKPGRKPSAAFMKPVTPSPALAEIVGAKPIPRTEVTKRLWAYVKKNKLQDPKNKRMIKADAALKLVFGGKPTVNMFEMTRVEASEVGGYGKRENGRHFPVSLLPPYPFPGLRSACEVDC